MSRTLLPAVTFVNLVVPRILVVVTAVIAKAVIADTCESFVFVAMPAPEG